MPDAACSACQSPIPAGALFCPGCGARSGIGDSRALDEIAGGVPLQLGRALGANYQVRRMLGEGGFAQVFEVWDGELQRRLAVKVLKPDIAWSSGMLDRFRQETRSLARLAHPNILPIHFVGEGEGLVYYAMPFVEGDSLSALLRREGALTPDRALGILRPLLEALSHAHGMGLIHRDIKPDNIMLEASSGRPLLVDFGIAKQLDGGGHQTQTGFVVGTPQYMSPEQALGQGDVDARSDLYAVGAVLFQMVTGTPPFEGETSQEIVGKHLSEPAPVATARNARIPMWLSEVIVRCLAKRPAERHQSAAMLLDALSAGRQSGHQDVVSAERVAAQLKADERTVKMPSSERPAPDPDQTRPVPAASPARRRSRLPLLLGFAALAALAGWLLLGRSATLVVDNRLVEPVKLILGAETLDLPAGASLTRAVPRGKPLVAQWYLVRPLGPAGDALGADLQGTFSETSPAGRIARQVDARAGPSALFAPLITNASGAPLAITVNAGLAGAVRCDCLVRPGAVRARIGYYPLFQNSRVEARDPAGRVAVFENLGGSVDRVTGVVGLKFEGKDFTH